MIKRMPIKTTQVEMKMNHIAEVGLIKMLIFQLKPELGAEKIMSCELGMIGLQTLLKLMVRVILTSKFST